ncbi:MAG: tripartite tricarboxylate transporter TctB family protein [Burkholderiales bacterium]|nr:tripartite tricarboxylate transporter TctB family protein [Burkholderiales bacterium]
MAQISKTKECWFAVAMILLSAALLAQAFMYPAQSSQFPRFLMVLQLLFSAALLVVALRLPHEKTKDGGSKQRLAALRAPFQVFVASSAYVLAIGYVGYFVSTAFFLCGSMYWFGTHKPVVLIAVGAGFILTVYALFVFFIGVRLPEGILI